MYVYSPPAGERARFCHSRPKPTATPQEIENWGAKRLGAPFPAEGCLSGQKGRKAVCKAGESKLEHLPIDRHTRHLVFELRSPSRVEGRSSAAPIRSAGLGICLSLSPLGGLPVGARGYQLASPLTAGTSPSALPLHLALHALFFLSISVHLVARDAVLCAASYMR